MNIEELPQDSDSSDEDYVPEGKNEVLSEIESDGESEDPLSDCDEESKSSGLKRSKKGKRNKKKIKIEQKYDSVEKQTEKEPCNEEDKKKKADDLWADFMKDTGFQSKINKSTSVPQAKTQNVVKPQPQKQEHSQPAKVKITQIFEFAGEEVKIEKEVDQSSVEARLLSNKSSKSSNAKNSSGLSGISNVLSQLGKKQKISTLEKSKLDWDKFKQEENIEEELQTYNKGKDGYLDRQDFLQRADLRRFEIEKDIRNTERAKRFNTTL
ncbi:yeti [Rhynchophorus ferrugineus]|uniref:Craniofacial development protein 1 n=1 Tax=Rhynchophorus ferrugineus TaxID=354439 RepID=A0A834INI2_RHYFE|nr:hypothetical protein GWI33_005202 [Rhynchophorus ferrugineus]